MYRPEDDRRAEHGDHGIAIAEHRKEQAERRLDQDEIGGVADARPGPETESGGEAEIVAEAGLGVGEDTRIQIGLALGPRPKVTATRTAQEELLEEAMPQTVRDPA